MQATDKRPQAGLGASTDDAPASLLEGHFDESANRRAFLEALYEWRNDTQDRKEIPLASDSGHPRATAEGGEKPLVVPAPRQALAPGPMAAPTPGNNLALKNAAKHQDEQRKTKMVVRKPLSRLAQGGSDGGPQEGGKPKSYGGYTARPDSSDTGPGDARPQTSRTVEDRMSKAPQSATLHAAAGKGGVELMRQMLAAGRVEVNALDRFGASALLYAAGGGHEQAVQLLLDFNASLSAHSADGDTPLHAAAKSGSEATVRLLLKHGANAAAINSRGNTPAKLAAMFGRADLAALLQAGPADDEGDGAAAEPAAGGGALRSEARGKMPPDGQGHQQHVGETGCTQATDHPAAVAMGVATDTGEDPGDLTSGRVLVPGKWVPQAAGDGGVQQGGMSTGVSVGAGDAGEDTADAQSLTGVCSNDWNQAAAAGHEQAEEAGEAAERQAARALLEGLRVRARADAEEIVESQFSRPCTAQSAGGSVRDCLDA